MDEPIDYGIAPILHQTLVYLEMGGEYLGWPVVNIQSSKHPAAFSYYKVAPLGFLTRTTKPRAIR